MKPQLISLLMGGITLLAVPASAADETINCTATPDCTALGYTQSADSCPDGGIKCPFDEDRMFCLRSADLGFRIKNDVKVGDYLYTDGTSSATYTKGKGMVGIVLRPHPGNPRHALVLIPFYTKVLWSSAASDSQAICSDGFGRGILGTGKYLAGVGEILDIFRDNTIRDRITKMQYSWPGGNTYENVYFTSTLKTANKYYAYQVQTYSLVTEAYDNNYAVCVIYL